MYIVSIVHIFLQKSNHRFAVVEKIHQRGYSLFGLSIPSVSKFYLHYYTPSVLSQSVLDNLYQGDRDSHKTADTSFRVNH